MKRFVAALLVLASMTAYSQTRESTIYVKGGSYIASHNNIGAYSGIEYSRQIRGGLFWGAQVSGTYFMGNPIAYDACPDGPDPYRNTLDQNICKIDGMLYYHLRIIKDVLKLRAGAGLGLGWHHIFDDADKIIPYANASLNWIVKLSTRVELMLSPTLVLCPSEFSWSLVPLGGRTDINPWLTDYGISIGLGWRL